MSQWIGNIFYNITFEDYYGQANILRIRKLGYVGPSTQIKMSGNPIQIKYDTPTDNLLDPINGSAMTIELIPSTTFQFKDLYTSNNRDYRVEHLIGGSVNWVGFLLPEQYDAAYKIAPYPNKFVAADQLGFLKSLKWDHNFDTTIQYGLAVPTILQALEWIFEKTNIELNMREGLNVYERAFNKTVADSPLDQAYFHGIAYEGLTYYEVLEDILKKFQAILKQREGEWFIFRPTEAIKGDFTTRLWTTSFIPSVFHFNYTSNTLTNIIVPTTAANVGPADLVRIANMGNQWNRPAWRKYILKQDYGTVQNILLNGAFSEWIDNLHPEDWVLQGGINTFKSINGLLTYGLAARDQTKLISQSINTLVKWWQLTIEYNVEVEAGAITTVYFSVGIHNFVKVYDNSTGAGVQSISEKITPVFAIEALHFVGPPEYYALNCLLEKPVTDGLGGSNPIEYTSVILRPLDSNKILYDDNFSDEKILDLNRNFDAGEIGLIVADAPEEVDGVRDVFRGALFKNFTVVGRFPIDQTVTWEADGIDSSLLNHLDRVVGGFHVNPIKVLSVRIYSKLIDSATILQEINNNHILFMIKSSTHHVKLGYWQIEAFEVGFGDPDKYLLGQDSSDAEEYYLVDEHGNKIELF